MSLDEKLIELESDVKEMKSLLETAVRARVKDLLSINIRYMFTTMDGYKREWADAVVFRFCLYVVIASFIRERDKPPKMLCFSKV